MSAKRIGVGRITSTIQRKVVTPPTVTLTFGAAAVPTRWSMNAWSKRDSEIRYPNYDIDVSPIEARFWCQEGPGGKTEEPGRHRDELGNKPPGPRKEGDPMRTTDPKSPDGPHSWQDRTERGIRSDRAYPENRIENPQRPGDLNPHQGQRKLSIEEVCTRQSAPSIGKPKDGPKHGQVGPPPISPQIA